MSHGTIASTRKLAMIGRMSHARKRRYVIAMATAIALLGVTSCSSFIDEALATTVRPMQLTAALERACASGGVIPATELIPEAWDRMLVLPDGTYGITPPPVELPSVGVIFDAASLSVTPRADTPESMQKWLERRSQACILLSPDDSAAFTH